MSQPQQQRRQASCCLITYSLSNAPADNRLETLQSLETMWLVKYGALGSHLHQVQQRSTVTARLSQKSSRAGFPRHRNNTPEFRGLLTPSSTSCLQQQTEGECERNQYVVQACKIARGQCCWDKTNHVQGESKTIPSTARPYRFHLISLSMRLIREKCGPGDSYSGNRFEHSGRYLYAWLSLGRF